MFAAAEAAAVAAANAAELAFFFAESDAADMDRSPTSMPTRTVENDKRTMRKRPRRDYNGIKHTTTTQ